MNLQESFKNKKQFIPFVTCGFPKKSTTIDVIKLFLDKGVEIIEVGIPFSDPVADGPTIQYSSFVALQNEIDIEDSFEIIDKTLGYKKYLPVIMTYLNPVIIYGIEKFFRNAKKVGIKGLIFADAIVEEKDAFYNIADKNQLDCIFLLSPTTNLERRKKIYRYSKGFIYIVTVTGTTGVRKMLPEDFYKFIKKTRKETKKPLCAGFGISNPNQVLPILDYIDGFIVGSAIVEKLKQKDFKGLLNLVEDFVNITGNSF